MRYILTRYEGRMANQMVQAMVGYSYSRDNDLEWFVTPFATSGHDKVYYDIFKTTNLKPKFRYIEPTDSNNQPFYHIIPKMEDFELFGWYQTPLYFNKYRDDILKLFDIPWEFKKGCISLHWRLGDYITYKNNFPPITIDYVKKAVEYYNNLGYSKFIVFSDSMNLAKKYIEEANLKGEFQYSTNPPDVEGAKKDFELMSSCEHHIIANSSFSWLAAWFNQNPSKIILSPSEKNLFKGANRDMLRGFDNLIQIEF